MKRHPVAIVLPLFVIVSCTLCAGGELTREAELRALREEKSRVLAPDRRNRIESVLLWMQERKIKERLETPGAGFKGFRPKLGGLSTGSGFAFGVQFDRPRTWSDRLDLSFSAAASPRKYQSYDAIFDFPRLLHQRVRLTASMRYRNMPQEDYFGLGPDTSKGDRSDYLYEDTAYELAAGLRPIPHLFLGSRLGWLHTNVGEGTDRRFPSTTSVFDEKTAPGLSQQADFLRGELFAELDYRDFAGNPHRGAYYRLGYAIFDDVTLHRYGFGRLEAEVQQYLSFNHGHRVIALRFSTSLDHPRSGQSVPFYLQRTLGGSNDLRGFREFRFRDQNVMVINLEYRWEAWIGLDMALFADAGKVFRDRSDFDLRNLESDVGIGFRFNVEKGVFWRIDIARSREGTRVFMKFNHVF
ncbi:MAG: BamA/TamA family outer membrane protein [Acidobacteria bacterium]|nr:BamA/TamA family outer membrane protein [Acidobacteriota bacterium]